MKVVQISARDNALVKQLRKLAQDPAAYRKHGQIWVEGDHLCRAALERGLRPAWAVIAASANAATCRGVRVFAACTWRMTMSRMADPVPPVEVAIQFQ